MEGSAGEAEVRVGAKTAVGWDTARDICAAGWTDRATLGMGAIAAAWEGGGQKGTGEGVGTVTGDGAGGVHRDMGVVSGDAGEEVDGGEVEGGEECGVVVSVEAAEVDGESPVSGWRATMAGRTGRALADGCMGEEEEEEGDQLTGEADVESVETRSCGMQWKEEPTRRLSQEREDGGGGGGAEDGEGRQLKTGEVGGADDVASSRTASTEGEEGKGCEAVMEGGNRVAAVLTQEKAN